MRRQEFIDSIETWSDLLQFCYEEDCSICSDVVSDDERHEAIEDRLIDWARNNTWRELYDILNALKDNDGYDWYSYDDYYDTWEPLDDYDFDRRKESVIEWMDDEDYWDDSDEDDEEEFEEEIEEEPVEPEDQIPTPEEDCSFHDLFASGVGCLEIITAEEQARELGIEQDFAVMTAAFKTI